MEIETARHGHKTDVFNPLTHINIQNFVEKRHDWRVKLRQKARFEKAQYFRMPNEPQQDKIDEDLYAQIENLMNNWHRKTVLQQEEAQKQLAELLKGKSASNAFVELNGIEFLHFLLDHGSEDKNVLCLLQILLSWLESTPVDVYEQNYKEIFLKLQQKIIRYPMSLLEPIAHSWSRVSFENGQLIAEIAIWILAQKWLKNEAITDSLCALANCANDDITQQILKPQFLQKLISFSDYAKDDADLSIHLLRVLNIVGLSDSAEVLWEYSIFKVLEDIYHIWFSTARLVLRLINNLLVRNPYAIQQFLESKIFTLWLGELSYSYASHSVLLDCDYIAYQIVESGYDEQVNLLLSKFKQDSIKIADLLKISNESENQYKILQILDKLWNRGFVFDEDGVQDEICAIAVSNRGSVSEYAEELLSSYYDCSN